MFKLARRKSLSLALCISKIITQVLNQEFDKEELYEVWDFEWNEIELFDEVFEWLEKLLEDQAKNEIDSDKKLRLEGLTLVMVKIHNVEFITEIWRQLNTKGFLSRKSMMRFLNEACDLS